MKSRGLGIALAAARLRSRAPPAPPTTFLRARSTSSRSGGPTTRTPRSSSRRFRGHPVALDHVLHRVLVGLSDHPRASFARSTRPSRREALDLQIVLVSYDSTARHAPPPRPLPTARGAPPRAVAPAFGCGRRASNASPGAFGLGSYVDLGEHIVHSFRIVLLDEDGVVRKALDAKHAKVSSLFEEPAPTARSR